MANQKQGEKSYLEEHSKEKVAFYEKYLDLYLTVLLNAEYVKAINIYDIFCGIGIYDGDGSKGSPIVAMESIKRQLKIHWKHKNKPISLLINDGHKDRIQVAKNYIENNCNNKCTFLAHNLDAKEIFPLVINQIKNKSKENHLVFIDPHGYKDIYKKDIVDIMEAGKSEILIFLPVHLMYRFLKPSKEDKENPSYEPLRRFMTEFNLEYDASLPQEYIAGIEKAFCIDSKYYSASYRLRAENSNNYYALFFITKHIRGLEKAIDTKWKLDELCGEGFEKTQHKSLFEEEEKEDKKENCIAKFKDKLIEYLYTERTNNEIYTFSLINGFLIKQANDILRQLSTDNKLCFDREVRKNAFYLTYKNYKNGVIKYKVKINE